MVRILKIILILAVMMWALVGAVGNFMDWDYALDSVAAVTSMTTIESGVGSWQATSNPLVLWAGALFIVLSKVVSGILCAVGAAHMWRARGGGVAEFAEAKAFAMAGCAVAVIMLFGGFFVVAESWFELWRAHGPIRQVLSDVFRYASMIALIAIFVASPDDQE